MAEKENRFEDNLEGAYYVDEECIHCDKCSGIAPDHFRASDEDDHHIVFQQPADEAERLLAEEALYECPADAIGNDG